ncbi:hypothetical protein Moror_17472 [Moniliophthora roreri MCA 2997]|uniref:Spo12-like protein n=2 Tax=Moniliophthora roreri TaxID=221103 RepID=V2XYQ1_MONRO|nr:hypothetical protein Moror_17472 [Moniliophthora roreri MCA 2997]KAI3612552.1 hypothetical protein WG66_009888 [Moniliophthora roreri]
MSSTTTPNDSPNATPIQPLHNPANAAHVVVPQAPLGNVVNAPGMGAKALLAKKMAKSHNPAYISPTDNLMTPCTQKLSAAKKKHFTKTSKPVQLFAQREEHSSDGEETHPTDASEQKNHSLIPIQDDDENPF